MVSRAQEIHQLLRQESLEIVAYSEEQSLLARDGLQLTDECVHTGFRALQPRGLRLAVQQDQVVLHLSDLLV